MSKSHEYQLTAADMAAADLAARQGAGHLAGHLAGFEARDIEAAYQRARQMLAADLLDPAQAVLEALLLLQPASVRFARALGMTYLRKHKARKARDMFLYGLRLDARDAVMHLLHGECVLLCGERERGMQLLESALAKAGNGADVHAYVLRAQKCLLMARQRAP